MNDRRWVASLLALATALASACGPKQVRTPQVPGQAVVVLLPDGDGTTVGRAAVSNSAGGVDLATARASTRVSANQPPARVIEMSEAEIKALFGDALSALPPPAAHFTLFFRFDSDELTDESRALVPQILQAVKDRAFPEVSVVGHTDTTGTPASNFDLGLKRANFVRALLVQAGMDASLIEVISHGESELLIPTADEILEPRNRRVEIAVR
jgi:outer membrane protein OmpA-like peptidoglycan-associated protein